MIQAAHLAALLEEERTARAREREHYERLIAISAEVHDKDAITQAYWKNRATMAEDRCQKLIIEQWAPFTRPYQHIERLLKEWANSKDDQTTVHP